MQSSVVPCHFACGGRSDALLVSPHIMRGRELSTLVVILSVILSVIMGIHFEVIKLIIIIIIISKPKYTTIVPFPLMNDAAFTLQRYRYRVSAISENLMNAFYLSLLYHFIFIALYIFPMSPIDVEEERGNTHTVLVLTGREGVRDKRKRRNTYGDHLQLVLHSLHLLKEVIIIST